MDRWFTVEQLDGDTFAVSEYKHWEEPHCYLLCGTKRALLIDTGLGVSALKPVIDGLTDLPVTVAATHIHWDHIGGLGQFPDFGVHEAEKEWISGRFPLPLSVVKKNLTGRPCDFPVEFSPENYKIFQGEPRTVFRDGDRFELGGRQITAIHTPGHSPGHCCFYEPDRGYLYAGDLIYSGCLDAFYPTTDPRLFFQSIKKILALKPDRILPGHHSLSLPAGLAARIGDAFQWLEAGGILRQGSGLFDFGDFQIHI